ncbi:Enkurin domain-containing protein 1 [Phytophthora boehmeriae]|uniref:Enkurin domain-containing protein 1 n=1 Tax=Phytophthora boehmeriae TaxID=109152 RepID=A0A8T1WZH6_9STRA|nr:Enkurin domain-containing protein 1 [Phytophthora boehmeriae]
MSARVGFRRRDANASDAVAAILNPHEGYREKQVRRGITPKDFERENKLRVKKLQEENREIERQRRAEEAKQQEDFKLRKFKSARSRVYSEETESQGKKHEFLRRGGRTPSLASASGSNASLPSTPRSAPPSASGSRSELHSPTHSATSSRSSSRTYRKAPVPSVHELERREETLKQKSKKEPVDFINANAWEVIKKAPSKHSHHVETTRPVHRSYGRIPRYLLERKEQWAREEEERRRNAPDPDCPPGMVLLDEDERVRTLEVLHKSLIEAQTRMNAMPLCIETFNQIRRKNELETKLQEIEDAIKVFDRAKVYVAAPLKDSGDSRASLAA